MQRELGTVLCGGIDLTAHYIEWEGDQRLVVMPVRVRPRQPLGFCWHLKVGGHPAGVALLLGVSGELGEAILEAPTKLWGAVVRNAVAARVLPAAVVVDVAGPPASLVRDVLGDWVVPGLDPVMTVHLEVYRARAPGGGLIPILVAAPDVIPPFGEVCGLRASIQNAGVEVGRFAFVELRPHLLDTYTPRIRRFFEAVVAHYVELHHLPTYSRCGELEVFFPANNTGPEA